MNSEFKKNIIYKFFGPLCFLLLGVVSLFFFIQSICSLFTTGNNDFVLVNQGSYYMFGVSIFSLFFSLSELWHQWIVKGPINGIWIKIVPKVIILSLIITLLLPHIIYYFADHYLVNHGYQVCEAASRSWLYIHKIVYVHPPQACYKTLVFP